MVTVFADMSMSLNGFVAGPNDSVEQTLVDGVRLCGWASDRRVDLARTEIVEDPGVTHLLYRVSDGYGEPATETYLPRVLDRLNYDEHPPAPRIYVPKEKAAEYAEEQDIDLDAPAFERKAYDDLTDHERIHGLRAELARQARHQGGKFALRVSQIQEEVFDSTPSKQMVRRLIIVRATSTVSTRTLKGRRNVSYVLSQR